MNTRDKFFTLTRKPRLVACLLAGVLLSLACPLWAQGNGWVITTDYSTFGQVRDFATSSPWAVSGDLATIPGDAVGRFHDGKVYIVGRGTSNTIQVYDPANGFALVREFSVGAGRNPQDIAFAPDGTAFVSCYDSAELLAVDVTTGVVTDSYSTVDFADADGLPETAWLVAVGEKLYVATQLLDRNNWYTPTGPGVLLVFDMVSRTWVDQDPLVAGVQPIALVAADPYTDFVVFGVGSELHLRVGCVGSFGLTDGGIEEVNLSTGKSQGLIVTESELGGDVMQFVQQGNILYVLVSDASFITSVVSWNLTTASLNILGTGSGYVYADLALAGDHQLFVADRTLGASGLRVWDTVTGLELTTTVLATGLPPFMMIFPPEAFSPVPSLPMVALKMGAPYPNPGNPRMRVALATDPQEIINIAVVDLRGRVVTRAVVQSDNQGRAVFDFDGRDAGGRTLASGIYQVIAEQGPTRAVKTWTLVR